MDPLLKILMEDEELDYDDDVIDYPDRLPELPVYEVKTVVPVTESNVATKLVFNDRTEQLQRIADEIERIQAMQKAEVERYRHKENRSPSSECDDTDARSVFVNGVDYSASRNRLEHHFSKCGAIVRVTILMNPVTSRSKGAAYVEFESADAVKNALQLNSSVFCGRKLLVVPKRTNKPGFKPTKSSNFGARHSGYNGYRGRRFTPY